MHSPLVSIIILTCNRKDDLISCLNSLKILDYKNTETIVIDNNSQDNTYEEITEKFPEVNIKRNSKNLGADYPRNQAINIAKGKYIWFLDSDTIVLNKEVLTNMVETLEKDLDIGALGGQILKDNNELKYWVIRHGRDDKIPIDKTKDFQYEIYYLPTCNLITRMDILKKIGGFDTNYFYYCEDEDLCLRIKKEGKKLIFKSNCCVLHNFSQDFRIGDYNLQYRNLLRCFIINKSLIYLAIFPFTQTKELYKSYKRLKKQDGGIKNLITIKEDEKGKFLNQTGMVKLGLHMMGAIFKAQFWNLRNLPLTLEVKYRRPNFLKDVKEPH
jgi:GT2 family glycosyltransferase